MPEIGSEIIMNYALAVIFVVGYAVISIIVFIRRQNRPAERSRQNQTPEWLRPRSEQVPTPARRPQPASPQGSLIDINCATERELATLPGVTPEMAKTASFMQQNGGFASLGDFIKRLNITASSAELSAHACCSSLTRAHSTGRTLDI